MPSLSVLVDGALMPEAEARAFWTRFSDHMEAHKGDLAGFAKSEGFVSVRPAMGADGARLIVSKTAAQVPYRNASADPVVGSPAAQAPKKRASSGVNKRQK